MEYKIIERPEFLVIGLPIKVSLKDSEYQKKIMGVWMSLMPRVGEIKNRKGELFYGLCNLTEGIKGDECSFENIAGVEVTSEEDLPKGMKCQKVPAAKYFVVTHKGKVEKLGETYGAIESEMKKLELNEDKEKMFFELYDERFKEDSDDSEVDIYSPLK